MNGGALHAVCHTTDRRGMQRAIRWIEERSQQNHCNAKWELEDGAELRQNHYDTEWEGLEDGAKLSQNHYDTKWEGLEGEAELRQKQVSWSFV